MKIKYYHIVINIYVNHNQNQWKSSYPLYHTYNPLSFQIDFQNVDQRTGGKWLLKNVQGGA